MTAIKLVDARRGLNIKCRELFKDEKIAEGIYRYLCDGIEECDDVEPERKGREWIPVTERLPEKYIGEWLCCTDDGKIMILPYDTPGDGSKECVFYAWDDDGYFYKTFNVTHWMPLPEPPKEET